MEDTIQNTTAEIMKHIKECDQMYEEIHGQCTRSPECNVCRKLLKMGFELTSKNLPEICIMHCERWKVETEQPPRDGWRGFSNLH